MLARLCQLKSQNLSILVVLLLTSCSWYKKEVPPAEVLMSSFTNNWYRANKNHSLLSSELTPVTHLFLDSGPEFNAKERTVQAVIATPANSEHAYEIDLYSGQRYFGHSYCDQTDVSGKYEGAINRPNFSIGYIPRVLDQLGGPQKIIIFSNRKKFIELSTEHYQRVRIVGAYIEQICPENNCAPTRNWLSRLVFLGVDQLDQDFEGIKLTQDLLKKLKWDHTTAILENLDGFNFVGEKKFPRTKVVGLIEYEDALSFMKKHSILLTDLELKKIRSTCHSLYDKLWHDLGEFKAIEKNKSKKKLNTFSSVFTSFVKDYYNEVSTCEKFIYHGNINKNTEEFWFMSQVGLYFRLHRDGYYFDCKQQTWKQNVVNNEGHVYYDLKRDIDQCDDQSLDMAMERMPNFLNSLRNEKSFYQFIDYDNHAYGTHQKMYSWIKVRKKNFSCTENPEMKMHKEMRLFPEDVTWKKRYDPNLSKEKNIE